MEQGGVHPLQPTGPLIDQVLVETHQHPGVEHLRGRDPRLRHPAVHQQLAKMTGVSPVGLSSTLLSPQGGRFRRLGHMGGDPGPHHFLDDITPARATLQHELDLAHAVETVPTICATAPGSLERPVPVRTSPVVVST